MGKYRITAGQNIYDVALHIYGSIEGVVDLMINNLDLSLDSNLKTGDELVYSDDFIINADVVAHYRMYDITPSGGERSVYPKSFTLPAVMEISLENLRTTASFVISGSGEIEIDWGDNSDVQRIKLTDAHQTLSHLFDNQIQAKRQIKIYSNALIKHLNIKEIKAVSIYMLKRQYVERFTAEGINVALDFAPLLDGVFEMNLRDITTDSLLPLVRNKSLMRLDLTGVNVKQRTLDEYLVALVTRYGNRRNCTVTLPFKPSGEYREPTKDENGNYILTTGMEAIWVIVNEPAWNEGGLWKFIIDNQTYTYEQNH